MSSLLTIYGEMFWNYKPLKNFTESELKGLKIFISKYPGNHYGYSVDGWLKAVDYLIINKFYKAAA